ncbi:MAG: hypothetical protein J5879_10095 [Clostridia bacterium]|nr:hypothetical protein [Clostridia bacterium]
MKKAEQILGNEITVFNWLNTDYTAFELYLYDDLRLRVQKKAFWRISQNGKILYSSANRIGNKQIVAMRDLLEEKKIKKITEQKNGDVIIYLNKKTKLELFKEKDDSCVAVIE